MVMDSPVLVLPGFGNSGPGHWQTLWEKRHPAWRRVDLGQWDAPDCQDWVRMLDVAVQRCGAPPILVAHSLACLLVAHWARQSSALIKDAFLVAIPEPASPSFPAPAKGFMPVPMHRLTFPTLVVASTNDSFGSIDHARMCAAAWGSRFVDVGEAGHINADSGLGDWTEGYALFQKFMG